MKRAAPRVIDPTDPWRGLDVVAHRGYLICRSPLDRSYLWVEKDHVTICRPTDLASAKAAVDSLFEEEK